MKQYSSRKPLFKTSHLSCDKLLVRTHQIRIKASGNTVFFPLNLYEDHSRQWSNRLCYYFDEVHMEKTSANIKCEVFDVKKIMAVT